MPAANSQIKPVSHWSRYYGNRADNESEAARINEFRALTGPRLFPWIHGLQVILRPGEHLSRVLYVSGCYEPNSMRLLEKLLPEGGTFIDAGANTGLYSLLAARLAGPFGQVVSYEPSPREFESLVENVRANHLGNLALRRVALGDEKGKGKLRLTSADSSGLNTLCEMFAYSGTQLAGSCVVDVCRLDDEVEDLKIQRIDMMKIDVEGFETQVILGAREALARFRPVLLVEILKPALALAGSSVETLEYWLRENNYVFLRIDDDTGSCRRIDTLAECNEENIVALPWEKA